PSAPQLARGARPSLAERQIVAIVYAEALRAVVGGLTTLIAQIGGDVGVSSTKKYVAESLAPRVRCLRCQAMAELMPRRRLQAIVIGGAIESRFLHSARCVAHVRHARCNVGRGVGSEHYGAAAAVESNILILRNQLRI